MALKFPDIDPTIISFGPIGISWYSLSYVCGVLLGWMYINRLIENNQRSITKQHMDDFVSWAIIGIIIGGRLGHVLFYEPDRYLADPVSILKTYEGGMSFHGGILGYMMAAFLFYKKHKIILMELYDLSSAATPIGLCLGRIANFINAELYGKITNVPWSFVFPLSDGMPRHPTQLYEAFLEGFVLFWILYFASKKNALHRPGLVSGLFLVFYGLFRIFVEFFKEHEVQVKYLTDFATIGQILCIPMIAVGSLLIIYGGKRNAN